MNSSRPPEDIAFAEELGGAGCDGKTESSVI